MTPERFNQMLDESFQKIYDVLGAKAEEYAVGSDRLHNFIQAGKFKQETPAQALWGFETKHLISIQDMVKSGDYYPLEKWDEKIFDAINYLLLLRAVVIDEIPPETASYSETGHFDGDGCCDSSENKQGFTPAEYPSDPFLSALARAFKEVYGEEGFVMHINNYLNTPASRA